MKFKLICFATLIGIMLLGKREAIAQQATQTNYFLPTFYPRAPNTASLEKFGTYEVNLFTGLPDISIPLYTIETNSIKIPISLSYHASGIRVSELASWVGLGWALSAGGTVSRKIVGSADDGIGGYMTGHLRNSVDINAQVRSDMDYLGYVLAGTYDTRPDIFSYNFPGHIGKFFLDGTNNFAPVQVPFSPVKISYTNNGTGSTAGIDKFVINDEHGNQYKFGDQYIEPTYSGSQTHAGVPANTGWPLEQVVSQDKRDVINFTYSSQMVNNPDANSYSEIFDDNVFNQSGSVYTYGDKPGGVNTSTSHVNEQLLQHIDFKNGRVDFELDPATRTDLPSGSAAYGLKDIIIYKYNFSTNSMEQLKKIVFYKSYFNGGTSAQRLRLDSIQILDNTNNLVGHYVFGYDNSTLPSYYSLAQDYWGYYNGKINNTSLIPFTTIQATSGNNTVNVGIGGGNRNSDSTYMQAGVLKSIRYPTGGRTEFRYQTNQYIDGSNVLQQAGGLRIDSILSYDGVNPSPVIKFYQYNIARNNFILNQSFFSVSQTRKYWASTGGNAPTLFQSNGATERTFVSNSRVELEAFDGAVVVYPKVTEFTGTPVNNTGKTVYEFRDLSDVLDISSRTGVIIVNSSFYSRGQLSAKSDYLRKADGSYQIVRAINNSYTAFPSKRYDNVGLVVGKNIINEGLQTMFYTPQIDDPIVWNGYAVANYNITSDDNYLTGTTTTNYDLANPTLGTASSTQYSYANIIHQQPTTTTHVDSKGNTQTINMKYPADYLPSATTTTTSNSVLDAMLSNNMQAEPIEKWTSYNNGTTGVNGVLDGQLNIYRQSATAVLPDNISTLQTNAQLTNFTPSSVASGEINHDSRYIPMITFNEYDLNNNLIRYTPKSSSPTGVFWGYQGEHPIAQVQNVNAALTAAQLAYTSFETSTKNNWAYNGTPAFNATAPSGSWVYALSSGVITSPTLNVSQPYIVSYWSNSGLAIVTGSGSISGTAVRTVNGWTYYEHQVPAGTGQVSISGSATIDELRLYPSDAQMTTYIYGPAGLTCQIDPKSTPTYYEYDGLQRLYRVKDQFGNIVKQYCYNYAGQATNCAIPYVAPVISPPTGRAISITGPATGYMGQSYTFTVQPTLAGDSFVWSLPSSGGTIGTIQYGQGTSSVTILLNTLSGTNPYPYTIAVAVTGANGSVSYATFASQSVYCNNCAVN